MRYAFSRSRIDLTLFFLFVVSFLVDRYFDDVICVNQYQSQPRYTTVYDSYKLTANELTHAACVSSSSGHMQLIFFLFFLNMVLLMLNTATNMLE